MAAAYPDTGAARRGRGIAVALAVHVLLGWLLVSGTARHGLDLLTRPLQAVVIQEVTLKPPPPPPAPRPLQPARAQPAVPPPFVPIPEVAPAAPPALAIEAVAVPHEPPPPAPAPQVVAAPAPAPAPAPRQDMAVVCPTQVAPEMPRRALIDGIQGVVRAQVRIVDGAVREVSFLSGPRIFQAAVRSAMLQYKCSRESGEVVATQDFNFRLQP